MVRVRARPISTLLLYLLLSDITTGKTGTATFVVDAKEVPADRTFKLTARLDGESVDDATTFEITIKDTGTATKNVLLEVDPDKIYEKGGMAEVMVTARLDGKAFDYATIVVFDIGGTATRNLDYDIVGLRSLTIEPREISGQKDNLFRSFRCR